MFKEFQMLLDAIDSPVLLKDQSLKYVYVSKPFEAILGEPTKKCIGKTAHDFLDTKIATAIEKREQKILQGGFKKSRKSRIFYQSGHSVYTLVSYTPLTASDGTKYLLIQIPNIVEDKRTSFELKGANERAETALRSKTEFLNNMSHEIRTPMNGVMGMAELLAKTELTPQQKTFADLIVKSGASLLNIINDILDFSAIGTGKMLLSAEPFTLDTTIEDLTNLVRPTIAEKDLELIVRIDPSLPNTLVGDGARIRQVIMKLLDNAVKFTEVGHIFLNVTGTVNDSKTNISISLEDTGIGIEEKKLLKIFEAFNQADNSTNRTYDGMGLGLSLASSMVELMDGTLEIKSTLGKGSKFKINLELPFVEDVKQKEQDQLDLTGARILIVDDNKVNRTIMLEHMAAWNFDSVATISGEEALSFMNLAKEHLVDVDCIILDYQMPNMNGEEFVTQLRSDPVFKKIPIIMLSSIENADNNMPMNSLDIQANLKKPVRAQLLLDTIRNVFQEALSKTKQEEESTESNLVSIDKVQAPKLIRENSNGVDILVCEDNEVNQIVFSQILDKSSYTYHMVKNGAEGVDYFKENRPSIILMDVSMPRMNGLDATREIRKLEAGLGYQTPIIGVTAHAMKGDQDKCLSSGMNEYIIKPVSPDLLTSRINYWMAKLNEEISKSA